MRGAAFAVIPSELGSLTAQKPSHPSAREDAHRQLLRTRFGGEVSRPVICGALGIVTPNFDRLLVSCAETSQSASVLFRLRGPFYGTFETQDFEFGSGSGEDPWHLEADLIHASSLTSFVTGEDVFATARTHDQARVGILARHRLEETDSQNALILRLAHKDEWRNTARFVDALPQQPEMSPERLIQRERNRKAIELLTKWLDEDKSIVDDEWDSLAKALDQNRTSSQRKLFS